MVQTTENGFHHKATLHHLYLMIIYHLAMVQGVFGAKGVLHQTLVINSGTYDWCNGATPKGVIYKNTLCTILHHPENGLGDKNF